MKKLFGVTPELLGDGRVLFDWSSKGNYLAVTGSKRKCCILDRNGRLYDEVHFPAADLPPPEARDVRASSAYALQWDPSGEQLAILPSGNTSLLIWSALTKEVQRIDSEFKTQEFSCLAWSRSGLYLAIGTAKGNLMMYNSREKKKVPYVGKHTKKIVTAVWNKDNLLALTSLDRTVTITDGGTGETTRSFVIKGDPVDLCVSDKKDDGYSKKEENTYSVNVNRKTIYIMQCTSDSEKPLELAFLEQYGAIQKHMWFGDGYILVGFRNGYIVVVSSHSREISEEVHSGRYLDLLTDVAYSPALGRIALAGSSSIRVVDASGTDYTEVKSNAIDLDPHQLVEKVGWTKDGQVLTVGCQNGYLYSYLAALPTVYDFCGSKVIYMTSLLEMSLVDVARKLSPARIEIETEPSFCGLGPAHAVVGMNNQAWYYSHSGQLVNRRDYLGSVTAVKLNSSWAAVLTGGLVVVHPIQVPAGKSMDEFDVVIPKPGQTANLTCVTITSDFIITGSKTGVVAYFACPDVTPVNEYRHEEGGITRLFVQPEGSRLVFEDDQNKLFLFNPVNDQVLELPEQSGKAENVMWDVVEMNLLAVADANSISVYLYVPISLDGPSILLIGKQSIQPTHTPLVMTNGVVGCRLKNGSLDSMVLETHKSLQPNDAVARANPQRRFTQALKLYRLRDAWECATQMRSVDAWQQLGGAALEILDLDMAIAAHRMLGDASMVLSLERVKPCEDKNLRAAHVLVLLEKDYDIAQELFLRSSQPRSALDMRKDLKHWAEALALAERLDPDSVGAISKEHAASLEMVGEYSSAKAHYQQAMEALSLQPPGVETELKLACQAGIARTTLNMGDLRQGRQLALQLNSPPLFKECALILEGLQQLTEAAEMHERGGQYERAASIYIQTKNFSAAAPLMAKISSSKLQLQFAKAKEAEGRYQEASGAYETAGDLDSVVRLCLERLNNPQKAYALVRRTKSVDAAALLSRHCMASKDFQGAVEFLLMAGQMDQAFDQAQKFQEMDTFARCVINCIANVDYPKIAQYYESRGEFDKAGDMWAAGEQYPRAVQLYLKVGTDAALEKAIGVVEKTQVNQLCLVVMDFVNEEREGIVKDQYRFKLNIAMGLFADAARDAMEMARFEQEEGNYRVAHDKLFATFKQLESLHTRAPGELMRALLLLHSYTLVKSLIAVNDHVGAARMLVRVAHNISKFPKHIVPILTSTVIECQRAGLKKTAFEYASMLMRSEYREHVAIKYRKKIELMVRRTDREADEVEEAQMDCPFCNMPGLETDLQCAGCQNVIPFDIATGKRIALMDWAECPACRFPCSHSNFLRILTAERKCPMCNEDIAIDSVKKVLDPIGQLKKANEEAKSRTSVANP
ncbi:MAG: hypothetical protein WDW36_007181 [Sanguina aurantia]